MSADNFTRIGPITIDDQSTAIPAGGPLSGDSSNVVIDIRGVGTAAIQPVTTTGLTYRLYISADGGTTWSDVKSVDSAGNITAAAGTITADTAQIDYVGCEVGTHLKIVRQGGTTGTVLFTASEDPLVFFTIAAAAGSGAVDTELPAAAALTDNFANPTAPAVGGFNMVWDGATWDRAPGTSTDGALVNLGTNNDVTVTSGSITADTELPAAAALTDNFANPTAPGVGGFNMVWDGATWDRAPGTSTDGALVNLGTNNDVTVTGTVTSTTGEALTDDGAFSVASSKVFPIGALADQTSPDLVDEGDIGALRMTLDRLLKTATEIESGFMRVGGASATIKFASITATGVGDNQIVAAVASNKIRVLSYVLVADAAEVCQWQDGGGNNLSGSMSLAANGGIVCPFNPGGWFETASGQKLDLNNVGGADIDGHLSYIEIP